LLQKVVFRTIPDHQARYASLVSGQLDVIIFDRGNLIQKAKDDPSLNSYKVEGNGAEIILMNSRKPPLDDIRIRRALVLANNQELHVKMVYKNLVSVVHHPLGEQFTCEDDGYLDYDLEKARELLEMQRIETDATKRQGLLCDIIRQLNRDAPFLYRGGRGYHIITRKKIRDMLDTPGFNRFKLRYNE
jgi:ABC-type transport system substrate-binding protein